MSDEHLTADEVAGLIGPEGPAGLGEQRAAHAKSCDICQRVIKMHEEHDLRMQRLAGGSRGGRTETCPGAEEWAALAAGLADSSESDVLLAHASECDACGATLHAVAEDFAAEPTEAESGMLAGLASAQPQWQRRMAHHMARESRRGLVVLMPVRAWLARAAAVIVAVGAGLAGWQQWIAPNPAKLIAQAYTGQRPFEFRIPDARYAKLGPVQRGSGSPVPASAPLLEAQARIARELEKHPDNVKALDLRARSEMLNWDVERAIATLLRALRQSPGDPQLLADLGTAYALREDYKTSLECLTRALQARPDLPEAVFNRALVYERLSLPEEARREWKRYLDLDRTSQWREEAQRR